MKTLVTLLAMMPMAALAQGKVDEARLELLVSIICDNGGSMHTSKAAEVLPAQGFTMTETQGIVAELENRDQLVPTEGIATLSLKKRACR